MGRPDRGRPDEHLSVLGLEFRADPDRARQADRRPLRPSVDRPTQRLAAADMSVAAASGGDRVAPAASSGALCGRRRDGCADGDGDSGGQDEGMAEQRSHDGGRSSR